MQGHRSCEGITVIYVHVGDTAASPDALSSLCALGIPSYCCGLRLVIVVVVIGHANLPLHRQMRVHRSEREHPELLLQLLVPTAASADARL